MTACGGFKVEVKVKKTEVKVHKGAVEYGSMKASKPKSGRARAGWSSQAEDRGDEKDGPDRATG